MNLYISNRLEILAERLAETLASASSDPMERETVVVQSRGMQRWISMQIAARNGICANIRFPFPKAVLSEILSAFHPEDSFNEALEPDMLTWRILHILQFLDDRSVFAPIRNYLKGDEQGVRRFQISSQLAHLYDQYLVFRPEKILQWEKGAAVPDSESCQAELWRRIRNRDGCVPSHLPARREAFVARIQDSPPVPAGLPKRISLFGISYLPRQYLDIFCVASKLLQINIFALNPCREYWLDIRNGRQIQKIKKRMKERGGEVLAGAPNESSYWETGNRLLASFGEMGRDFFNALIEYDAEIYEDFTDPDAEGILGEIQRDIFSLRNQTDRCGMAGDVARPPVLPLGPPRPLQGPSDLSGAEDNSLKIHSCHTPMREVEVLWDQILAMFEEDPGLKPSGILVMAPDIGTYIPYISAVFDSPAAHWDAPRIPYTIADRTVSVRTPLVRVFFDILSLADSRFEASRILGILEEEAVHKRFALKESDLVLVRRWTEETAIRWGIDDGQRRQLGLPAVKENTWRSGLDRLLLGYAMRGIQGRLFEGLAPSRPIEGDDALVLGRFVEFAEKLFDAAGDFAVPRTLTAWRDVLDAILDDFFFEDRDSENELRLLRSAVRHLNHIQQVSGNGDFIDIRVVRVHLAFGMESQGSDSGYLARGVTFCSLLPMRSIPADVIYLLGMNYSDYPRKEWAGSLNLMSASPRPGDRSKRKEDRYLFLEAILSARRRLHISYIGQNAEDNGVVPPSVVVSELLDYVDGSCEEGPRCEGLKDNSDLLVTRHPLHAFSSLYFGQDPKLFSYSRENCDAARCLGSSREEPAAFANERLPAMPSECPAIDMTELEDFFVNPSKFFLEKRLGVILQPEEEPPGDTEPFDLAGLEKYRLEQAILDQVIDGSEGGDIDSLREYFRATGWLPHGTAGNVEVEGLASGIRHFSRLIRDFRGDAAGDSVSIDLQIGSPRLLGRIENIFPQGFFSYRYGNLGPKDHLRLWIRHLALSAQKCKKFCGRSILMGREETWIYGEVDYAKEKLEEMVDIYLKGHNNPTCFFPNSSWEYARRRRLGDMPGDALGYARQHWDGNKFLRGECHQPHIRLCFRNREPFGEIFPVLAERILIPLMDAAKRLEDQRGIRQEDMKGTS